MKPDQLSEQECLDIFLSSWHQMHVDVLTGAGQRRGVSDSPGCHECLGSFSGDINAFVA